MTTKIPDEIHRVFNSAPFIADIGFVLKSIKEGECITTLEIQQRHLQQDGFVHAGVQATLADHTAGAAAFTLVHEDQIVLTVEFKINFLRPARGTQLFCRSSVLKPGRQLTVVESEVFCVNNHLEQLVSKATVSLAVVTPPPE